MPSFYDDLFNEEEKENRANTSKLPPIDIDNDRFQEEGKESLDEVLSLIQHFRTQAESFSRLLTNTRAIDHEVEEGILDFFFITEDEHDQGSLAKERKYYAMLQSKFEGIVVPMKALAKLHVQTVTQFNRDIDSAYYSVEKTDQQVEIEKEKAVHHIHTQRKILADAAKSLSILEEAMQHTEKRIRKYIDVGGINNISISECEILIQKRIQLTQGERYQFDHSFFEMNIVDKAAIAMGVYLKETTTQYLGKLNKLFR